MATTQIPHLALITSTYRAEQYFGAYIQNVRQIDAHISEKPIFVQLVLIANAPTPAEEVFLQRLATLPLQRIRLKIVRVPREGVYASWNRGVRESDAPYVTFWGIDDTRQAQALITGYHMLKGGCQLVYFPYRVVTTVDWLFLQTRNDTVFPSLAFNPQTFAKRMSLGPFWMMSKELYDTVGAFDEHFRVCGDFEWCQRAIRHSLFCPSQTLGGTFVVHGDNLSANTNPLKIVEENVIYLRYGMSEYIRPCDPDLMREAWQTWGANGVELSAETQDFLWGEGAKARQEAWLDEWHKRQRQENIRRIPRLIMERLGLRPLLAKIGVVKSPKR